MNNSEVSLEESLEKMLGAICRNIPSIGDGAREEGDNSSCFMIETLELSTGRVNQKITFFYQGTKANVPAFSYLRLE